jgi:hypothetical protein
MIERRLAQRFDLSLPILLSLNPSEPTEVCTAYLRDISTAGLYFRTEHALDLGTQFNVLLAIPLELTRGLRVAVCASGRVVRQDQLASDAGKRFGIAAVIEHYDIIRPRATSAVAAA